MNGCCNKRSRIFGAVILACCRHFVVFVKSCVALMTLIRIDRWRKRAAHAPLLRVRPCPPSGCPSCCCWSPFKLVQTIARLQCVSMLHFTPRWIINTSLLQASTGSSNSWFYEILHSLFVSLTVIKDTIPLFHSCCRWLIVFFSF